MIPHLFLIFIKINTFFMEFHPLKRLYNTLIEKYVASGISI